MPLVVSLGATTIMEFTDRLFLARYSLDAVAAATPSGITALLAMTIFLGTSGYVSVFVAQYIGQGSPEKVGRIVWQGIYVGALGTVCMLLLALWAEQIYALAGHAPHLQALESAYFRALCLGSGLHLIGAALSGFFSGLGHTRIVMLAHVAGMLINIPLDFCMINGVGPFPEWGIVGAGVATAIGWALITLILGFAFFSSEHERCYHVLSDWHFRWKLWLRLLRFGLPSGMEFFLDIFAFTVFILVIGRLGTLELAATNIALNINALAFMPLVGFAMGTSTLVGQALGARNVDEVPLIVRGSLIISFVYLGVLASGFLLFPETIIGLFQPREMDTVAFAAVVNMGRTLLFVVVLYLFFDGVSFILYAVLKGAGDTHFVMISRFGLAVGCMIVPLFVGMWAGWGLMYYWMVSCTFLIVLSVVALWRYRQGKWRTMLVVEAKSHPIVD